MEKGYDKNTLKDVMALCVADIKQTCGVIFPEIFYAEFSGLHQQIFDLINAGHKKIAIAAPRGIGKTSIARAVAMRAILFRLTHFIVYVSNSATSAEMQTENMKRDLLTNKMVRQFFGNIKENIQDEYYATDESFSKKSWTAFGDIFVLPRGAGQQVRGLNWANFRPGLIIIDDLEDKNEIRSKENRDKIKEWFHSDLTKTEDRYGDGCIFIYIDTIKHEDSLLVDLIESGEWASIQLSICDDDYNTLDPNYMSTEEIKAEVAEHRKNGTLDTFYMERRNIPVATEDAIFKNEQFRHFEDKKDILITLPKELKNGVVIPSEEIKTSKLIHVTIVDPAKTVKITSAETSVQTVGVDTSSRKIFNRYICSERMKPEQIYNEMFRQIIEYNSFILGYEVTGLNEFIIQPIESECRVRGIHPHLVPLSAKKGDNERGKVERIKTLAPLYNLGYIYHNVANCGGLEGQLLSFPRSKLWDIMDGFAYITYIMDKNAIYFDPTDNLFDDIEDEDFSELELEDLPPMNEIDMGLLV